MIFLKVKICTNLELLKPKNTWQNRLLIESDCFHEKNIQIDIRINYNAFCEEFQVKYIVAIQFYEDCVSE